MDSHGRKIIVVDNGTGVSSTFIEMISQEFMSSRFSLSNVAMQERIFLRISFRR